MRNAPAQNGTEPRAVIVDTAGSPYARLRPVPIDAVQLQDEFWEPRRRINRTVTLPAQYRQCEDSGRIDNFRRAAGWKDIPFQGIYFNDSDVYKWLEAAAWTLSTAEGRADAALAPTVETVIEVIEAAQDADGYLNTYFTFDKKAERFTNLRDMHELYCAGHFMQAAIAHHRATGDERLMNVARRLADCIGEVFGPQAEGRREETDGHEEIEMALAELSRATGEAKYLKLAQFFVDARGQKKHSGSPCVGAAYYQDHEPLREQGEIVGHAVRAVYLCAGAADALTETGDDQLRAALDRLWHNMTTRRMYVSGGVGARHEGEAFGNDYELPNARAYAETCAAIGVVMWAWRMLQLEGAARYADVMERALYNGVLSGLSLDGAQYFYVNPLEDGGAHRRQAWYGCACCPPNIARLMAQLPGYFYSVSDEGLWVHFYAAGAARIRLSDGRIVRLRQSTRYPWDGDIAIQIEGIEGGASNGEVAGGEFSLFLRVPDWCEAGASLELNEQADAADIAAGCYVEVRRAWKAGDVARLRLPMPVRRVACHPNVGENAGCIALMRGPLLFCVEGADHAGVDVRRLRLPSTAPIEAEARPDLLGGVVVLRGQAETSGADGSNMEDEWSGALYRTAQNAGPRRAVPLTAIPYYAWANREPGPMRVWLPQA